MIQINNREHFSINAVIRNMLFFFEVRDLLLEQTKETKQYNGV